jgi:WD40 repeat protein
MLSPGSSKWMERLAGALREHEGELQTLKDSLPRYRIVEEFRRGGMGVIYRAWDAALEREVALKVLPESAASTPEARDRFLREAQLAAQLHHPHIVPVYDTGTWQGQVYLSMPLIDGTTLDGAALDLRGKITAMRHVALAIHHAHGQGIVHRDIKPSNLLYDNQGRVYVTDFGLARRTDVSKRLTLTGEVMGTPAYMPPEQARGQEVDARSDVYSLGATLYELVCGRAPFLGSDAFGIVNKVLTEEPAAPRACNPLLARDIETIIQKAMDKVPARRYATAGELAEDLGRYLEGRPIRARPASVFEQARKWSRRHPAASALMAVSALALIAMVSGGLWYNARLRAALAESERRRADGLLNEGNVMSSARRWVEARERYQEARAILDQLGASPLAADLGIWDTFTSSPPPLLSFQGHAGAVRGVAFSPDGRRALTGGADRALRLWKVSTGEALRVFEGHAATVSNILFSPDGRRALSRSDDHVVKLWDLETGRALASYPGNHGAGFTHDGRLVLLSDAVHDAETGTVIANFSGSAAAYSPFAMFGSRTLSASGFLLTHDGDSLAGHAGVISTVAFSPDGKRALSGSHDNEIKLWDLESRKEIRSLLGHTGALTGVLFLPDGLRGVSAGEDRTARLWDLETGRELRTLAGHLGAVTSIAASPDGRLCLSGGGDGRLLLHLIDSAPEVTPLSGHDAEVSSIAFSPDGRWVLSGSKDKSVRLWDAATGLPLATFKGECRVQAAALSADGRLAVTGGHDGSLELWDATSGRRLWRATHFGGAPASPGDPSGVAGVALSDDGRLVLSGANGGGLKLWEVATGQEVLALKGHARTVPGVAFRPDRRTAVSGSLDGTIRVWELESGLERRSMGGRRGPVWGMALSPDGAAALSGNEDRTVSLWDLETGEERKVFSGHTSPVRGVALSPDGRLAASASLDRTIKLWDIESGREVRTLTGHAHHVLCVAFSPDGRSLLSGSLDMTARLWDFSRLARHREFEPRLERARWEDPASLAVLGDWYAFRGHWKGAVELLERSRSGGAAGVSSLTLARCHLKSGDFAAARREFERALERTEAPDDYLRACMKALAPK